MVHANARLTPAGRAILCRRIANGRPVAQVAAEMGISRTCAYRWWARYRQGGPAGLIDRPSWAHHHPRRVPVELEAAVLELRQTRKLGPARIAPLVGLPASTVYRVLCRHRRNRLAWMDRPTGQPIRRYERAQPGELVHMDVKKLGRIPAGGGHRVHGRDSTQHRGRDQDRRRGRSPGYDYIHSAVDDRSRVAFSQILPDESAATATRCSAMGSSTPRSMTIPGWPTPRSWPTSRPQPAPGSCAGRGRSSPPTTSASSGS